MTTEKDEASHDETVIESPEGGGETEFRPFDEIAESYSPSVIMKVTAADGLPTQFVSNAEEVDIPELSPETLVCMGDFSEFTLENPGANILAEIDNRADKSFLAGTSIEVVPANRYEGQPEGDSYCSLVDRKYLLSEVYRDEIGVWYVKGTRERVYPKREPCKHYVRQVTQLDLNPKSKVHFRLCAARRTTEGAFMTVRDIAMWACSMREPRDLASEEKYIDSFDEQKMKEGATREYASIFGNPVK